MVFYYTVRGIFHAALISFIGGYKCFMGRDKYENEDLIAYGWPEDVWYVFHYTSD